MQLHSSIKFHWSSYPDEILPEPAEFIDLCRCAEACGFESVHVPATTSLSDSLALAMLTGLHTAHLKFRIGWNFDRILATLCGREMKEAWTTLQGRLIFHMSFGTEGVTANAYYPQAQEFLMNCRRLFDIHDCPEFDIEGETAEAAFLGIKQGDCLWRLPNRPSQVYADALPVLHFGKQVGLVTSVIARETQPDAREAFAGALTASVRPFADSSRWLTPYLWEGNVSGSAGNIAALVGSFEEVAGTIHEFKKHGILQFLIRGRPEKRDLQRFGDNMLPRIRALEASGL